MNIESSSVLARSKKIQAARSYAEKFLTNLKRGSGETYAAHGKDLAAVLQEVTNDASILSIAILHDILQHPDGINLLQASPLTKEERSIVERMHQLRRLHIDANTDDLDFVIDSFVEDPRLMLLRMAHRLNDVRHIDRFKKKRRHELAHETLHMYTAIAGRLGFHHWRWQLEDISFLELQPRIAQQISKKFSEHKRIDRTCLDQTRQFLLDAFAKEGLKVEIDERIKGTYSTYRKMIFKKRSFEELTDRLALRILVPKTEDCYRALGIVHSRMHAIPGKLKDYIGMPKENGYQSIHTVVYPLPGVTEHPIEIQIRTHEMHKACEYGIASHANYKNWAYALTNRSARVQLIRNLENLRSMSNTPEQFEKALRSYFREDDIIIFDPENTLYHLHPPVTALDFAVLSLNMNPFDVTSARINGRKQPISTLLRDGDTVEIVRGGKSLQLKEYLKSCEQAQTKKVLKKVREKTNAV